MRKGVLGTAACLTLLLTTSHIGSGQTAGTLPLDSLLRANRKPMTLVGAEAGGPGFDLLVQSAADAQFLLIGEEHNLLELNQLAVALYDTLQARYGFQYLVLEQGNVIASWLDDAARHGGLDSVQAVVRSYPVAPTFATDQELDLIAHVATRSKAPGPAVWGVDQELGAMHLLERLAGLAKSQEARRELMRLANEARPMEETRTGDVHYLYSVANPEEYYALSKKTGAFEGPEAEQLLDALTRTVRIYAGQRRPESAYDSGREREESMRARFMEHYRQADRGTGVPKAIVKMGHWHTFRGFYRGNVPTFGNFLMELSASNGLGSLMVSTHVISGPEDWRNAGGVMAEVGDPQGITLIDLRPLRSLAHRNRIQGLTDRWHDLIFQADLLLIIGGGRTGSYDVAYANE